MNRHATCHALTAGGNPPTPLVSSSSTPVGLPGNARRATNSSRSKSLGRTKRPKSEHDSGKLVAIVNYSRTLDRIRAPVAGSVTMRDEPILRAIAKEAIYSGMLPARQPDRTTLNGSGSGTACVLCGTLIRRTQIELDIGFERTEPRHQYSLHARCFSAWEGECTEFSRVRQGDRLSK